MAQPIIPWIGGKRRLAETLFLRFPAHQCYVELFAGGAALFFPRSPAEVEVINDVNGDLVNLYRVVKHHLEEFVRQFKWALSSRQLFKWMQATPCETLTDIQRAARFFYLQQQAFGGKVEGFQMESLEIDYTVGGGAKPARRGELIIYSWDRERSRWLF